MFKRYSILFALLVFSFVSAQDEFLVKIPIKQQVAMASTVVEGKVVSKKSYWDTGRKNIYTVHTIDVSKVYKGASKQQIHLVSLGGVVGFQAQIAKPQLSLRPNAVGVFVVNAFDRTLEDFESTVPLYKAIGLSQGFYRYNLENTSVSNPFVRFSNPQKLDDTLKSLTGIEPKQMKAVDYFNKKKSSPLTQTNVAAVAAASAISSISPTQIAAGNKSVLTISGSGFGASQGEVFFRLADDGGATDFAVLETQIVSWTDSEIQVEVPGDAGSGAVKVKTDSNTEFSISGLVISHSYITVNYSDANIQGGKEVEYRPHHISSAQSGGAPSGNFDNGSYVFSYHTDFKNNTAAVTAFEDGFDDIVCGAGIDFKISSLSTSVKTPADDNINSISFDLVNTGILGQAISRFSGGYISDVNGDLSLYWAFKEIDYVFDESQTWDFDLDGNTTSSEFDFNAVARHETGHAAGLGHVIDNQKIMYFSATTGPLQTITSNSMFNPILSKITNDKNTTPPSFFNATDFSSCYQTSLHAQIFKEKSFIVFPNPVAEILSVESISPIQNAFIYDLKGSVLMHSSQREDKTSFSMDVSHLNPGIYFISLRNDQGVYSQKFIKN